MSRHPVYLYDDPADLATFAPFTQSRPIGELRYGAWLLRERVERALDNLVTGSVAAPHLADFVEPDAPKVGDAGKGGTRILIRSAFACDVSAAVPDLAKPARLVDANGTLVGAVLPGGTPFTTPSAIDRHLPAVTLPGRLLKGAWELVHELPALLTADIAAAKRPPSDAPAGCTVLGHPSHLVLDEGASIEPLVVFDVRNGPIWIRKGAEVRSMSRLAGPLVIGEHTRVVGGQIRESSIGPTCVVHGEVSNSVFLGFANKGHDGFLGHSVIGRWVNLGAGTITSNLKNTYGTVRLNLGAERVETGLTFLGSLIGDHAKTAIGTMLPTGCVIGTGANVFGTARPANAVAPFAWGTDEAGRVMACRMFLQTASRVLPRRHVQFGDAEKAWLTKVWETATGQRCE